MHTVRSLWTGAEEAVQAGSLGGFPDSSHCHACVFLYNRDLGEKPPALLPVAGPPNKRDGTWDGLDPTAKGRPRASRQVNRSRIKHWSALDAETSELLKRASLLADPEPRGLAECLHFLFCLAMDWLGL